MSKLALSSGIAFAALMSLVAVAQAEPTGLPPIVAPVKAPLVAKAAAKASVHKPAVHKTVRRRETVIVSKHFRSGSDVVATKTIHLMQSGTTDEGMAYSHGAGAPNVLDLAAPEGDSAEVSCPVPGTADAAWKALPEDIRKTAKPGQCYAKLLLPPKFETYSEHVLVHEAHVEKRHVAEVTQMVDKDVLVSPEHSVRKTIAAVTHEVSETVIVHPASFRDDVVPAKYETHMEHVMVSPERKAWVTSESFSTGAALVTPGDHQPVRYRADGTLTWPGKNGPEIHTSDGTAEYLRQGSAQTIYCLKIVPAVYEDREVRVMVAPATTDHVEVPAVTREVTRTVVDVPEHVEVVTVVAVYEKHQVREMVTPEHSEAVTVPAVYADAEKTRVLQDARPVWRQVVCRRNASPAKIAEIQKALTAKGYDAGPANGELGLHTVAAMQKFEADNNLPQGQMSVEAVKLLGVDAE